MNYTPIKIRKGTGKYLYRLNYKMQVFDMMRNPETNKWEVVNRTDPDTHYPVFNSRAEATAYIEKETDKIFR